MKVSTFNVCGICAFQVSSLKKSWSQNSGGFGKVVGITMCARNPIELHCNLCK
jgi:hypothetical protein